MNMLVVYLKCNMRIEQHPIRIFTSIVSATILRDALYC